MQYYSTNHNSKNVSFQEAIIRSEAADGGLYMPEQLPLLPKAFINNIPWMSLKEITYVINNTFFGDDLQANVIKRIGDETADYPMPLYEIEDGIYVAELFHGPTKTVKDFGAITLTKLMREVLKDAHETVNVIVSTIGHTGNAIAQGFKDASGINVFILYPKGRSKDHIEPLSVIGDNIHPIEIKGSIDDCLALTAKAFNDRELNESMILTSANSMNIGSLLPSTIPFFHAYAQLMSKKESHNGIYVSVPSGNCGNLLACYIAKIMGLPIDKIVAACNYNGSMHHYLQSGRNNRRAFSHRTYAYGMDIPFTANVPRFEELCCHDCDRLRNAITSEICTNDDIAATIKDVYHRTGYLLDPHSAVAYAALKRQLPKGASGIVMATSHPSLSIDALNKINDGTLKVPYHRVTKNYCVHPEAQIQPAFGALKKFLKYYSDASDQQPCFA